MSASKQVLVKYGERKKVLKIPQDHIGNEIQWLTEEVLKAFGLKHSNVIFQRFDTTFEEYIDLESDSEVYDKDKLLAVFTPVSLA